MDKFLVTGGTGFFGLNFLNSIDRNTYLLGNKKKLKKKNSQIIYLNKITKNSIIQFIKKNNINVIIHAAAITDLELAENNKLLTYNTNVRLTKTVSDIAKYLEIKLVFISTDQLYDSKNGYSKESNKLKKPNYYSLTKYYAENYIKLNNKKIWILRCSFFGWGSSHKNTLVDFIIGNIKKKKNIYLWDNIYFNPLYVSELIDITKKIIHFPSGVYNVGTKKKLTKLEFGLLLAKKFQLKTDTIKKINYVDKKVVRPRDMSVNVEKITKIFPKKNFKISHHLELLFQDSKKFKKNLLKY